MLLYAILACFIFKYVNAYTFIEEECLNYTVYPVQYELTLTPYIISEEKFYYDGVLVITVIANVPGVRVIELDAKDLEISRDTVGVWFGNINIIDKRRPFEYDRKAGKLYLYLTEELKEYGVQKNQYYIKLSFTKNLDYNENGAFVVKYDDMERKRNLLSTRISPNYAKTVFPCFDNPQFEAVYKIRIYLPWSHHQESTIVIAQEVRRLITRDNYTLIEYMPSPQISTFQMGIHLSNFKNKELSASQTNDTVVVWAPSKQLSYASYILEFGIKIINIMHTYSGIKRPVTNGPINLVALPTNIQEYEKGSWNLLTNGLPNGSRNRNAGPRVPSGKLSFPPSAVGICEAIPNEWPVLLSDHKVLYYIQYTSANQKHAMSFDLAQQLSRIWLGNPGEQERTRWKQDWFKEGMATYLAYHFLSQMREDFWNMQSYGLHIKHSAMSVDWRFWTPPLSSFNKTLAVFIPEANQQLVQMKTAAILWMVENWLGSEIFHKALQNYLNSRRGKFVSIDDFAEYLQQSSVHCEFFKGFTVTNVLSTWINQPGYPLINVRVYRKEGNQDVVHLEQKYFAFHNSSRRDYKYLIPISYVTQYTDDCYNCFQPKFTIGRDKDYTFKENLNNGWIILNRNASGYYRVNYDRDTWNLIIKTLKGPDRNKIDPYSRAQIANDAFALYMAGEIDFKLAKNILDWLDKEDSYVVWEAAFTGFENLKVEDANIKLSKQLYFYWKMFMREKLSIIYTKLVNDFDRDLQTRLFRSTIITFSCYIDHHLCNKYLESEIQRIKYRQTYDPDLRQICYYKLLERSNGWKAFNGKQTLNRFEKEDASLSQELSKRELRFEFNLPIENKQPMALKLSTTTSEPTPSMAVRITDVDLITLILSLALIMNS